MTRLETARLPLSEIVPDPANLRIHTDRDLSVTGASLKRFTQVQFIVLQKATRRIIDGHGRYQLLQQMGETEADVVLLDVDDTQATAIAIALNRTQELAEWDTDALVKTLEALDAAGYASDMLGFNDDDLEAMLDEQGRDIEVIEDEPIEPPAEPVTRPGDVWRFPSGHIVACMDSTLPETREILTEGGDLMPNVVFTDPPYGVDYSGGRTQVVKHKPYGKLQGDEDQDNAHLVEAAFGFCADDVWVCASPVNLAPTLRVFDEHGGHEGIVVWNKKRPGLGYMRLRRQAEFIVLRSERPHEVNAPSDVDVWDVSTDAPGEYEHPTQKPVKLVARALRLSPGGVVADPFLGSGSTLIACEQLGRVCIGSDIDPAFVDVAIRRYIRLTGLKPTNQHGMEFPTP